MNNQPFMSNKKTILTLALFVAGSVLVSSYLVSARLDSYSQAATAQIDEQKEVLKELAVTTANNNSDTTVDALLQDCAVADRVMFDELLGRLDSGLSQAELISVENLFDSCAHFQSERKAIMVMRLSREVEVYGNYISQLNTVTTLDQSVDNNIQGWQSLVGYEKQQSDSFFALVQAQKQIIDTLLEGSTAESEAMVSILDGVKETQEALLFANTKATEIRTQLLSS